MDFCRLPYFLWTFLLCARFSPLGIPCVCHLCWLVSHTKLSETRGHLLHWQEKRSERQRSPHGRCTFTAPLVFQERKQRVTKDVLTCVGQMCYDGHFAFPMSVYFSIGNKKKIRFFQGNTTQTLTELISRVQNSLKILFRIKIGSQTLGHEALKDYQRNKISLMSAFPRMDWDLFCFPFEMIFKWVNTSMTYT